MSQKAAKLEERRKRLAKLQEVKDSDESDSERSRSREKQKEEKHRKSQERSNHDDKHQQQELHQEEAQAEEEQEQVDEEQDEMAKVMGFSSAGSSKGRSHKNSACEAVFKNSQHRREYRQYMYRRGARERALDEK